MTERLLVAIMGTIFVLAMIAPFFIFYPDSAKPLHLRVQGVWPVSQNLIDWRT